MNKILVIYTHTGYLRDVTGSYNVCFLCMGTCMVMGGLPLLLVIDEVSKTKKLPVNAENNNLQDTNTAVKE